MTKEKWIPRDLKKGALTETVKRRYGEKGFTEAGTIKVSVLHTLAKEPGVTGKRARFAENVRK
jgi:hypothetical protein